MKRCKTSAVLNTSSVWVRSPIGPGFAFIQKLDKKLILNNLYFSKLGLFNTCSVSGAWASQDNFSVHINRLQPSHWEREPHTVVSQKMQQWADRLLLLFLCLSYSFLSLFFPLHFPFSLLVLRAHWHRTRLNAPTKTAIITSVILEFISRHS